MPPNVRFLPQKPLYIRPRLSSRQRRETTQPRPSSLRRWGNAGIIVCFVLGVLVLAGFFYLGVKAGILPGEFVHGK